MAGSVWFELETLPHVDYYGSPEPPRVNIYFAAPLPNLFFIFSRRLKNHEEKKDFFSKRPVPKFLKNVRLSFQLSKKSEHFDWLRV